MNSSDNGNLAIPVHRVYEMRGTLFHEVQAHKLALNDLGKAIAINPSHAGNYFLRGDCQYKLGNYEQVFPLFKYYYQPISYFSSNYIGTARLQSSRVERIPRLLCIIYCARYDEKSGERLSWGFIRL